jgi:thioredoxin 1
MIAVVAALFTLAYGRGSTGCFLSPAPPQQIEASVPTEIQPQTLSGEEVMSTASTRGKVEHADEATFQQQVLESDVPVLVDFYADWCGPCKMIAPVLEEVAREVQGVRIVKVNVDNSPRLAARYGISSIPSLLVFKDGQIVSQHVGLAGKAQLKALLES